MSRDRVDLTPGAVLHIKGFSSRGHPAKNKYLLILGCVSESEVLGFLISSQLGYLRQESHKKEVVRIPDRATAFFAPYESMPFDDAPRRRNMAAFAGIWPRVRQLGQTI